MFRCACAASWTSAVAQGECPIQHERPRPTDRPPNSPYHRHIEGDTQPHLHTADLQASPRRAMLWPPSGQHHEHRQTRPSARCNTGAPSRRPDAPLRATPATLDCNRREHVWGMLGMWGIGHLACGQSLNNTWREAFMTTTCRCAHMRSFFKPNCCDTKVEHASMGNDVRQAISTLLRVFVGISEHAARLLRSSDIRALASSGAHRPSDIWHSCEQIFSNSARAQSHSEQR